MKKTFKSTGIVMMLMIAMMAISCTTDDNPANKLVGTWVCTANSATSPHSDWGMEIEGSLKDQTITFKTDGSFVGTATQLIDGIDTGFWGISETHLYANESAWRIKSFSETNLKIEAFYVEERGLTYDTTKTVFYNGPFVREFKKK